MKKLALTGLILSLGLVSSPVLATTYSNCVAPYGASPYDTFTCTEDSAGTAATSSTVLRTATAQVTSSISSRISSAMRGQSRSSFSLAGNSLSAGTGMAAGDGSMPVGVWASYARTNSDNSLSSTRFDSDLDTYFVGADVSLSDSVLLGMAIGYENNDITTKFNTGSQDIDGFTYAPYLGVLINDYLSFDIMAGISNIDIDQSRTAPVTGTKVTSSLDSKRYFYALNLNAAGNIDNWLLGGRIGYIHSREKLDGFTESDGTVNGSTTSNFGQMQVGGNVAYSMGAWEPFLSVVYANDTSSETVTVSPTQAQPSSDDTEMQYGIGLRYFGDTGISGGFEWNTTRGRDDFDSDTFNINIRADF